MSSIKSEIAKGSAWMIGLKWFIKAIGIISTLILARLLSPEDFGIVATAMIFVALLNYLGEFGLDSALIHNSERSRSIYSSAWTVNLVMGVVQGALFVIFAQFISRFFNDERLVDILYLLSVTFVLKGAKNIGVVDFRKDMQFHKEFVILASTKLVSFFVTIVIAYYYRSYWALILGIVVSSLVELILSYTMHSFRPYFTFKKVRILFSFSQWLYLANLLRYFAFKGPNFILAKFAGAAQLGIYTVGYELGTLPTVQLMAPINRALFPGFAKLKDDPKLFKSTYLDSSSVLALVILPAGLGIAAIADILIPTAVGVQWLDSVPIVILIGALGAFRGLYANTSAVYMALGKTKVFTIQMMIWLCLLLPAATMFCDLYGSFGVAFAFLITDLMMLPIRLFIVIRLLNLRLRDWARTVIRPLYASLLMYLSICWISQEFSITFKNSLAIDVFGIFCLVLAGLALYVFYVYIFWWLSGKPNSVERKLLKTLMKLIRNRGISLSDSDR